MPYRIFNFFKQSVPSTQTNTPNDSPLNNSHSEKAAQLSDSSSEGKSIIRKKIPVNHLSPFQALIKEFDTTKISLSTACEEMDASCKALKKNLKAASVEELYDLHRKFTQGVLSFDDTLRIKLTDQFAFAKANLTCSLDSTNKTALEMLDKELRSLCRKYENSTLRAKVRRLKAQIESFYLDITKQAYSGKQLFSFGDAPVDIPQTPKLAL